MSSSPNTTNPDPFTYEPRRVKAMALISSIAEQLDDNPDSGLSVLQRDKERMDALGGRPEVNALKGVISDKIHFEDFCYNYKNYILAETIQLSKHYTEDRRMTRRQVLARLRSFMKIQDGEACLLLMSGHGEYEQGKFILETIPEINPAPKTTVDDDDTDYLSFNDIYSEWLALNGNNPKRHLLLLLDFCHSGFWVEELKDIDRFKNKEINISIQASCKKTETSSDTLGFGGFFINNWLHINGYRDIAFNKNYEFTIEINNKKLVVPRQTPQSYSAHRRVWEIYRLWANFDSWAKMADLKRPQPKGIFLFENGDIYQGSFKNVQLHGQGEKIFNNGDKISGFFQNDKLESDLNIKIDEIKKILELQESGAKDALTPDLATKAQTIGHIKLLCGFECHGQFKDDRPYGVYRAKLLNGEPWTTPNNNNKEDTRESVSGDKYHQQYRNGQVRFWCENQKFYQGQFKGQYYHGEGLNWVLFNEKIQCFRGDFYHDERRGIIACSTYARTENQTKDLTKKVAIYTEKITAEVSKLVQEVGYFQKTFDDISFENEKGQNGTAIKTNYPFDNPSNGVVVMLKFVNNVVDRQSPIYRFLSDGMMFYGIGQAIDGHHYWGKQKEVFKGKIDKKQKIGQGDLISKDGKKYRGKFEKDKYHGEGVLQFPDGRKFEGKFVEGVITEGKLILPNGVVFDGTFEKGLPKVGTVRFADGKLAFRGEIKEDSYYEKGKIMPPIPDLNFEQAEDQLKQAHIDHLNHSNTLKNNFYSWSSATKNDAEKQVSSLRNLSIGNRDTISNFRLMEETPPSKNSLTDSKAKEEGDSPNKNGPEFMTENSRLCLHGLCEIVISPETTLKDVYVANDEIIC